MEQLLSNLGLGFSVALSLTNLWYCFIGVLLGTLIGVLPGIGPLATIAMLLPVTFTLSPTFLYHRVTTPSATVSPSCGISTSIPILAKIAFVDRLDPAPGAPSIRHPEVRAPPARASKGDGRCAAV